MNFLIVVDMQNDFIYGSLGTAEAKKTVDNVVAKVKSFDGHILFTRDTHATDYLKTQEGKNLPVKHCIVNTDGWQICDALLPFVKDNIVNKATFGSTDLPDIIKRIDACPEKITLCGLCTDICVISNAMILKAAFPETKIAVDSACCAGVSPQSHNTALNAMKAVQIDIV